MISLEPKEQLVFDYIRENIRKNGYSPSIRDICTALDIKSTSTVHTCLERLEKKGWSLQSEMDEEEWTEISYRKTQILKMLQEEIQ